MASSPARSASTASSSALRRWMTGRGLRCSLQSPMSCPPRFDFIQSSGTSSSSPSSSKRRRTVRTPKSASSMDTTTAVHSSELLRKTQSTSTGSSDSSACRCARAQASSSASATLKCVRTRSPALKLGSRQRSKSGWKATRLIPSTRAAWTKASNWRASHLFRFVQTRSVVARAQLRSWRSLASQCSTSSNSSSRRFSVSEILICALAAQGQRPCRTTTSVTQPRTRHDADAFVKTKRRPSRRSMAQRPSGREARGGRAEARRRTRLAGGCGPGLASSRENR
mmetsp:Transcript_15995/g.55861  ORF Transcript_15995/g.55861 Transcript_15995/m.55861 type:complete len:282 (-) Transcript_15995:17-862(-)